MTAVKICGLTQAEHVLRCLALGVDYLGFVAYPKSPRHVTAEQFQTLVAPVTPPAKAVLVTVDAEDELLDKYLVIPAQAGIYQPQRDSCFRRNDGLLLQCHGNESPARLREIRARYGCGIIKAITDPAQAAAYGDCADILLLDAAPAAGELPGGNARSLDWSALKNFTPSLPWFLSGGLTPQNVAQAIRITQAKRVDVSSGVERERGVKDLQLIEEFVHATRR